MFRFQVTADMVFNALITRDALLSRNPDKRRNMNDECGYPDTITIENYKDMYDRNGIGRRIISLYPDECWKVDPELLEDESPEKTEVENRWIDLEQKLQLNHYMHRVDEQSGIGRFGILLWGLDDGNDLETPVPCINERGERTGNREIQPMYLRVFSEYYASVVSIEQNKRNPRYGQPTMYEVDLEDYESGAMTIDPMPSVKDSSSTGRKTKVHWTRVTHVADNLECSEVYGTPRLQPVYNRVYDLEKVMGGGAEMFWKGAAPGLSLEYLPGFEDAVADESSIRTTMENYMNGLQRYILAKGLSAKSLAPQVADPEKHFITQIRGIAMALSVPYRVLIGSESAVLASEQDEKHWNDRLMRRMNKYINPRIVLPVFRRLQLYGVMPPTEKLPMVKWPDLGAPSEKEQIDNAKNFTEAMAKYVERGVSKLVPPENYFTYVHRKSSEQVNGLLKGVDQRILKGDIPQPAPQAPVDQDGKTMKPPKTEGVAGAKPAKKAAKKTVKKKVA
jgi:hypothetical protein